jgi:four helix bundle protein
MSDWERNADSAWLPHERLDVYRTALELHPTLMQIVPRRGRSALRDQLERASMSIVLNIAEGAGRPTGAEQRRFFDIARASANECAAIIDIVRTRSGADASKCGRAKVLLIRVAQMLSKLCARQ